MTPYRAKLDVNLTFSNSYSRLPTLLGLLPEETDPARNWREWFTALGREWTGFDGVGKHTAELRDVLLAHRNRWALLMTEREVSAWFRLPDEVEVFRGCGPNNRLGLSWSMNREMAARFPTFNRYRQKRPLLLSAVVPKERIAAVKLDRGEDEVIAIIHAADIQSETALVALREKQEVAS